MRNYILGAFVVIAAFGYTNAFVHAQVAATTVENQPEFRTNGTVYASVTTGTITYFGGNFTSVGSSTIAATGTVGVQVDRRTGRPSLNFPRVGEEDSEVIYAVVSDGNGGWYIGGNFATVGATEINNLAHILSDGTVDEDWMPNTNGTVLSLALSSTTLYVGGEFTTIGGENRNRAAAVNLTTGAVTAWNPDASESVNAIALGTSTIYLGGNFVSIGGKARTYLAEVDLTTGAPTDWSPGVDDIVHTIALSTSTIYVGGSFYTIAGQSRRYLGEITRSGGTATAWNPGPDDTVRVLALSTSTIYVGGNFEAFDINESTRINLAEIDLSTGIPTTWNPESSSGGGVFALALGTSTIYAGGAFTNHGGQSRLRLAELSLATGEATNWHPQANGAVRSLGLSQTTIYVGGANFNSFSQVALVTPATPRNRVAAFDHSTGEITSWNPNANGTVYALALGTSTLYLGGDFTALNGGDDERGYIAEVGMDGELTAWNPDGDDTVRTLVISTSTIYVGGIFTNIGGANRTDIAELNLSNGVATGWTVPNLDDVVNVLAMGTSSVYIGGQFSSIGEKTGVPTSSVGVLFSRSGTPVLGTPQLSGGQVNSVISDGSGGWYVAGAFDTIAGFGTSIPYLTHITATGSIDTAFAPNPNNSVRTMVLGTSTIYVGGDFTTIGGQSRGRVAELNLSDGTATAWNPGSTGFGVYSLAMGTSTIYVGGYFTAIGGQSRANLAELSLANGSSTTWDPSSNGYVTSLIVSTSTIYVGGAFDMIGTNTQNRDDLAEIVRADGTATAWAPNPNDAVNTLALGTSTIYIGGEFYAASGTSRGGLAEINLADGTPTAWDPSPGNIISIMLGTSTVYVAGAFDEIGGATRKGVAELSLSDGTATALDFGVQDYVNALAINTSSIYLGGNDILFDPAFYRYGLAEANRTDGSITSWNPAVNSGGTVYAMGIGTSTIFVGGNFSSMGRGCGCRSTLAELDRTSGIETDWNPNLDNGGDDPIAYSILVRPTVVYVGGDFLSVGESDRTDVAEIDRTDGGATPWNAQLVRIGGGGGDATTVYAIAYNALYQRLTLGGDFISSQNNNTPSLASFAPDTAAPVITILGENPVTISYGSTYTDAGATAADDVDGNLTGSIQTTNPVNVSVAGTYMVTYTVEDEAGNISTATRTVTVTPPSSTSGGGGAGTGGGGGGGGGSYLPLPTTTSTVGSSDTDLRALIASLLKQLRELQARAGGSTNVKFPRDLRLGMTGSDVKLLQQYLNTHGFPVALTGVGSLGKESTYFGPGTRNAVIFFQEAHKAEILTPAGLTKGNGFFGPASRRYAEANP